MFKQFNLTPYILTLLNCIIVSHHKNGKTQTIKKIRITYLTDERKRLEISRSSNIIRVGISLQAQYYPQDKESKSQCVYLQK